MEKETVDRHMIVSLSTLREFYPLPIVPRDWETGDPMNLNPLGPHTNSLFSSDLLRFSLNPLRPSIKLQILLLCFHTFITDVKGRSCSNINRISFSDYYVDSQDLTN